VDQRLPSLRPLTAFRILAALPVVFCHYLAMGVPSGVTRAARYSEEGVCALTFFFMLSGFILAYNYRTQFVTLDRRRVWNFWVLRWARLYPVHVLTFVMSFGCVIIVDHFRTGHVQATWKAVVNLTFTHAFVPNPSWVWFNPVSWSLSVEAFFYLTFPLWLWVLSRRPGPSGRWLLAAGLWLTGAALAWRFRNHPPAFATWVCYTNPLARLPEFLIGVLIGLDFAERVTKPKPAVRTVGAGWATLWEFAALAFLVGSVVAFPASGLPKTFRYCAFYTPAVAVLIAVYARQAGAFSRVLGTKPMLYLGELSFSLYMLHSVIQLHYMTAGWTAPARSWPIEVQWAVLFAVTFGATVLCYHCFEVPVRKLLVDRLSYKSAPKPAAGEQPVRRAA
jgi:peptidoglycan/LPS O-acetylase OafA/YrhL